MKVQTPGLGINADLYNEATFINYSFIPTSKFQELSGNGIFINVGIGYYF